MALLKVFDPCAICLLCLVLSASELCNGGITGNFLRKEYSPDMPLDSDVFQVHITQGDTDGRGVIISWITPDEPGSDTVLYWSENSKHKNRAEGIFVRYKFFNYTSGYIHHCTIKNLEYNTKYMYEIGIGYTIRRFWFKTPPRTGPDVPYTFGLIGDLGQTHDSNVTLTHYESNPKKGKTVLFLGDLSYSNDYPFHDNTRWDTWGRFLERNAAYQPWIWTAGNHELDFAPQLVCRLTLLALTGTAYYSSSIYNLLPIPQPFDCNLLPCTVAYAHKQNVLKRRYGKSSPQYKWLRDELPKVDRSTTPWLIVLMHCPIYTSNSHHFMEGETMRVVFESWFVKYKVDVVFSGHIHAYERSKRISNIAYNIVNGMCTPVDDQSAPVYITIGDGGNHDGPAIGMVEPQPSFSAYREASFGHGIFDIKNRTHAYFSWHRNQEGYAVEADSFWFHNSNWNPLGKSFVAQY
ncbi:hypothetical protein Goarm_009083 [Gossypium armourianum]|uniref:Purple acid phosphatase n=1 Tax=Gossypium armourianum TaxID=34283 RepID=A0A7J9JRT7_9ROSI|nr:hypothetical protein [Gossypium armourianum]